MSQIDKPYLDNEFETVVHQLNQEIDRLAFALKLDLSNHVYLHQFLIQEIDHEHDHFHKRETLKGLITLRGKISLELTASGQPDLPSPVDEAIYQFLRVNQSS
ncbi:hypothetical protein FD975_02550 [Polynucleobacter sp. AP-Jannik-300A-C4]|uniref:hypothetical protein n=1 Tax=Polynucleobacter sp. AP-Jannik-300A-C4 TaxID=2576928 RepID=UPI001BFE4036|nr:hypothetical protein [Polynucleobacter sp. AP-Jannik-300A-C4]QWE23107.1 hypothetical protein FD975_02550 [Polynucleobacter sp. AP-Jannik-300A-C4]